MFFIALCTSSFAALTPRIIYLSELFIYVSYMSDSLKIICLSIHARTPMMQMLAVVAFQVRSLS